jgi:hypothetical protein
MGAHLEFHENHGPAGPNFFQGKNDPITVTFTFVGVEGYVVFGEDVKFVVHNNGNITLVVQGRTTT